MKTNSNQKDNNTKIFERKENIEKDQIENQNIDITNLNEDTKDKNSVNVEENKEKPLYEVLLEKWMTINNKLLATKLILNMRKRGYSLSTGNNIKKLKKNLSQFLNNFKDVNNVNNINKDDN